MKTVEDYIFEGLHKVAKETVDELMKETDSVLIEFESRIKQIEGIVYNIKIEVEYYKILSHGIAESKTTIEFPISVNIQEKKDCNCGVSGKEEHKCVVS